HGQRGSMRGGTWGAGTDHPPPPLLCSPFTARRRPCPSTRRRKQPMKIQIATMAFAVLAAIPLAACRQEHPADPALDNPAPTAEAHAPENPVRYATDAQETRVGEDPEADKEQPRAQR